MYNILVVEDQREIRDSWVRFLRAEGFAIAGFEKAQDALDETSARVGTAEAFQLAVLDLHLASSTEPYVSDPWALPIALGRKDPNLLLMLVTAVFVKKRHRIQGLQHACEYLIKGNISRKLIVAHARALLRIRNEGSPQGAPPTPANPIFLFEHREYVGKGLVFSFDSAQYVLYDPGAAKIAANSIRDSDFWLLHLFLRRPNELLQSGNLPTDVVPGRIPPPFAGGDTATSVTQAISRIGSVLNMYLENMTPPARFFINRRKEGYIFNAKVCLSADG